MNLEFECLEETMVNMWDLMQKMQKDLYKAAKGNKQAKKRIRINSVLFGKVAKIFRKMSTI